jgi:hypothetical protein
MFVDDDPGGVGVVADDADVQRVAIEGEAHLGELRRRLPLVRLRLHKLPRRHGALPHFFVERAVERDRRARFHGADRTARVG